MKIADVEGDTAVCLYCIEERPLSMYSPNPYKRDDYYSICDACREIVGEGRYKAGKLLCGACGEEKNIATGFYLNDRKVGGAGTCRQCRNREDEVEYQSAFKTCESCGLEKRIRNFDKDGNGKRFPYCRNCRHSTKDGPAFMEKGRTCENGGNCVQMLGMRATIVPAPGENLKGARLSIHNRSSRCYACLEVESGLRKELNAEDPVAEIEEVMSGASP